MIIFFQISTAEKSHLKASRFAMDGGNGKSFAAQTRAEAGKRAQARCDWFKLSNRVDFSTPLNSDILKIDRYLPDRTSLTITLSREKDDFLICKPRTNTRKYKVKIDKLSLTMRKIALKPDYVEWVNKKLGKRIEIFAMLTCALKFFTALLHIISNVYKITDSGERARYPLTRTVVKHRNIPTGSSYVPITDIFSGRLPNSGTFK